MTLIMKNIYGMIAAQEVAYAKKKSICHSPIERRAGGANNARMQIYATVFCCFTRQNDSPCRTRAQQ